MRFSIFSFGGKFTPGWMIEIFESFIPLFSANCFVGVLLQIMESAERIKGIQILESL